MVYQPSFKIKHTSPPVEETSRRDISWISHPQIPKEEKETRVIKGFLLTNESVHQTDDDKSFDLPSYLRSSYPFSQIGKHTSESKLKDQKYEINIHRRSLAVNRKGLLTQKLKSRRWYYPYSLVNHFNLSPFRNEQIKQGISL